MDAWGSDLQGVSSQIAHTGDLLRMVNPTAYQELKPDPRVGLGLTGVLFSSRTSIDTCLIVAATR